MFREEKTFNLRFSLQADFPEEYEGEEDGYKWFAQWEERLKPELLKTVFAALRRHPSWKVHVRNRGISAEDEIEIVVERDFSSSQDRS